MLASGVLGLLLMGAAISGLLAGPEAPSRGADDDDGPDDSREGPDDPGDAEPETTWTGGFEEDGSLRGVSAPGMSDTPLAQLLFGEANLASGGEAVGVEGGTRSAELAFIENDDVFGPLEREESRAIHGPDGMGTPADDSTGPADGDGARDDPDTFDVVDTIPFPGGPDIPCVLDFDCGTDRLILDFDGTMDEAPQITVDLETLPGSALVEANGTVIALVEGAGGLTPDLVEVVMSGHPTGPAAPTHLDVLQDGGNRGDASTETANRAEDMTAQTGEDVGGSLAGNLGGDTPGEGGETDMLHAEADRPGAGDMADGGDGPDEFVYADTGPDGQSVGTVEDFDREADQIEILYDPAVIDDPALDVVDFEDGTGASIVLNGSPILHVKGAQGLDPAQIVVRPSENLSAPAPADS